MPPPYDNLRLFNQLENERLATLDHNRHLNQHRRAASNHAPSGPGAPHPE